MAWVVAYKLGGYGAYGGAFYIDPAREPLPFALAVLKRMPALLAAQLAFPPADLWIFVETKRPLFSRQASSYASLVRLRHVASCSPPARLRAWWFWAGRDVPRQSAQRARDRREDPHDRMVVDVRELMPNGERARRIDFTFEAPLEHPDYLWIIWEGRQFVPFVPPALGETREFPAIDSFQALSAD